MVDKQIRVAVRLDQELKEQFMSLCKSKAINSSELIRQLISQWIKEQLDKDQTHSRINDIK